MKAIIITEYGHPDVLKLKEVEQPFPGNEEVLIQVHAASINDWDLALLRGKPFIIRFGYGLLKPKIKIPGTDVAGRIIAVGSNVKRFQPGDEVIGDLSVCGFGSFAEYVCAPEKVLSLKSASLTFKEAAAVPHTATLALQGLGNNKQIHTGKNVLINGAGGSAGTFAVQLAKMFGANVTGVDSTDKLDTMSSIGADHVIDYKKEDFTKNSLFYDLILDFAAYHPILDYKRALSPRGKYLVVGGSSAQIMKIMLFGPWVSIAGRKKMSILMHKPNKDLDDIQKLIESGKLVPVIDKYYSLSEVPEALRYFGDKHAKGKIVITMEEYL
jgi:NADPH:quinone reductase-like Zn-dependent oxidoreductase